VDYRETFLAVCTGSGDCIVQYWDVGYFELVVTDGRREIWLIYFGRFRPIDSDCRV